MIVGAAKWRESSLSHLAQQAALTSLLVGIASSVCGLSGSFAVAEGEPANGIGCNSNVCRGSEAHASVDDTARPWHYVRNVGERAVEVSVGWSSCNRTPVPKIASRVIHHPGKAIITILVAVPEPSEGKPCHRLRLKKKLRLKLGRGSESLDLYDGSFSPPRLAGTAVLARLTMG